MDKVGKAFIKAKIEGDNIAAFLRDMAINLETPEKGYSFNDLRRDLEYALEWLDNDLDAPQQSFADWPDFDKTDGATWTPEGTTIWPVYGRTTFSFRNNYQNG